jgi:hypothetical protein
MRGSASAIIRSGVFILLLLSAVRSMSGTIKCLFQEGALENLGECSILSTRSRTLIGIPQTHPVGSLGETLRVTEETGKVHLHLIEYWDDRPPLSHRTNSGIANLFHELVRALILPRGPRDPKKRRRK